MDKEFSDFISIVLEKTDIVSLISSYVKLDRKGNTHWACCPFHHEAQPSFAVNAQRQYFHCFGCKESGNALSFLMKIENISFYDALKILAEKVGMEIPKTNGNYEHKEDRKHRETLYSLMRDAARHYHDNLSDPRAKKFIDYLNSRQLSEKMVTRFGLGASLDFSEMINYLKRKGYTYEQIHVAGIAEKKDGREYDVFGNRLMYPIIDNMNRVVAFGGRTLEKDAHFAKYRNSTQTDIFDKSNTIYGVNLLKKRKSKAPIDYVIMTEGYMDVIALHKAGFDTAVASMGTALTTKQARQIKLYCDVVYISYDGDTAGQKATLRGLDILRETGLIVKVVQLPDGQDPDDIIKRGGAEAYKKLLDEAIPLTAYKIQVLRSKYDLNDPDRKAMFAIEATDVVRTLDNPIEQEQYLRYISELTGFSNEALIRQANLSPREDVVRRKRFDENENASTVDADKKNQEKNEDAARTFLLASLLQACDFVDYDLDVSGAMNDAFSLRLYKFCREKRQDAPKTYEYEFGEEHLDKINALLDYKFIDGDGRQKFIDAERLLYCKVLRDERATLIAENNLANIKRIKELADEIYKLSHS